MIRTAVESMVVRSLWTLTAGRDATGGRVRAAARGAESKGREGCPI